MVHRSNFEAVSFAVYRDAWCDRVRGQYEFYAAPVSSNDADSDRRILNGRPSDRIIRETFKHQCAQSEDQSCEHGKYLNEDLKYAESNILQAGEQLSSKAGTN